MKFDNFPGPFAFAATALIGFGSPGVWGDEPLYDMPAVYISASRIPANNVAMAGRNAIVLNAEEIARRAPETLADLIASLPGVDSRTRGPLDVQTDLEVNGATYSQVLILVDGMRVNDPQTGHHSLNLPLAPADLERVEVVYGAGSSVHGPDAFGAVVNLVPRANTPTRVDLVAHWGQSLDDSLGVVAVGNEVTLRHGWKGEWGSAWFAAGKGRSDGYRDDTDFDTDRLLLSARVPVADGQLALMMGVRDKEFGANDFYVPYRSKEWTQAWLYSARYQRQLGNRSVSGRAYYRRHRDRFVLFVDNPSYYDNRHVNETATVELHGDIIATKWGAVIAGGEFGHEMIDSNLLGEHEQNRSALFAEYRGGVLGTGVSTGFRVDRHEGFGWEASPSLSVGFGPGRHRVFASIGRSYRAPSFTELYYKDPATIGNEDLRAERSWSFEAGVNSTVSNQLTFRGAGFVRFEKNLVDYVRPDTTYPWTAQNLGKMRCAGVNLLLSGNWDLLRVDLDYAWVDKEQTLEDGFESKYVFAHARHQIGLRLHHDFRHDFSAGWHLKIKEREIHKDYLLLDFTIKRQVSYGLLLLRVSNLTDARYEAIAGAPMPGRWFSLETQLDL